MKTDPGQLSHRIVRRLSLTLGLFLCSFPVVGAFFAVIQVVVDPQGLASVADIDVSADGPLSPVV